MWLHNDYRKFEKIPLQDPSLFDQAVYVVAAPVAATLNVASMVFEPVKEAVFEPVKEAAVKRATGRKRLRSRVGGMRRVGS